MGFTEFLSEKESKDGQMQRYLLFLCISLSLLSVSDMCQPCACSHGECVLIHVFSDTLKESLVVIVFSFSMRTEFEKSRYFSVLVSFFKSLVDLGTWLI